LEEGPLHRLRRMTMKTPVKHILSPDEIAAGVARLAGEIRVDYRDTVPLLICVLNASFMFTADLARALDMPLEIDFIGAASYDSGTTSSGAPRITRDLKTEVAGRHVILIEAVVDTGITLTALTAHLAKRNPATVKVCALVNKQSGRKRDVAVDYAAFTLGSEFVVGYGLDYEGHYRNLPGIYLLEPGGQ